MPTAPPSKSTVRFGVFELDLAAGELRKRGVKIHLQEQPFRVLAMLVERPGEVVRREELRERLWPSDTFVDFDRSLNTVVSRIREALGDPAENPRFVETLPRRGYRFIAPVNGLQEDEAAFETGDATGQIASEARAGRIRNSDRLLKIALVTVSGLLVVVLSDMRFSRPKPEVAVKFNFSSPYLRSSAISPNGRYIAYVAGEGRGKLWVRDLAQQDPREMEGTVGARLPFWSPDSDFIGFAADGELKRIPVAGGPTMLLCQIPHPGFFGGTWSLDGASIAFSSGSSGGFEIYEVSGEGGKPRVIIEGHSNRLLIDRPSFLPANKGGQGLLLSQRNLQNQPTLTRDIVVQSLETGRQHSLTNLGNAYDAIYSPSGHVLYQTLSSPETPSTLWALPFSIETWKPTGEAFLVARDAERPSVAADGTLVYQDSFGKGEQLVWLDRGGKKLGLIGKPQQRIELPSLSPDGSRVVVLAWENGDMGIWVHDVARGLKDRLVVGTSPWVDSPAWSSQGGRIVFSFERSGELDMYEIPADGSGDRELLLTAPGRQYPKTWSRNEKYLIYVEKDLSVSRLDLNIFYLERQEDGSGFKAAPFAKTPFVEGLPDLSPDGRFLAYESNETGAFEIYVRSFPEDKGLRQVSTNGGRQPRWSKDGKELFYVEGNTLVAVSVTTRPTFDKGPSTRLFTRAGVFDGIGRCYDVSADGKQFVLVEPLEEAPEPTIRVVQNWVAEFRDRQRSE